MPRIQRLYGSGQALISGLEWDYQPSIQYLGHIENCGDVEVIMETNQGASRIMQRMLNCKDWIFQFFAEPHSLSYYADQLSVGQEMRGNTTVRIKHETRGFHLNNLSYAGPIVMGVGADRVTFASKIFEPRLCSLDGLQTTREAENIFTIN
ncbi:hypothetical protein AAG570_013653 [Ranatra chinensis]|uniref:Uncharacterized protein n=1 Tax=Ranatra chinensis TaxID=642074 RepID=A0ABD0YD12_9HEMI